ncbi:MAG: DAK2 domain-containing protein [Mycobacteriaceae bacterium]|nr:DAK2 domain-containing protein [Mycobacteriaceae bacterium]MBV9640464.1 DAK2 domain-containing protein [Mycobacteriaceae bacterium]
MAARRLDASALRDWAHAAVGGLVIRAAEINRLNVFPVADSDTGANMLFTMRSALEEANRPAHRGSDEVERVAADLARGGLHGARGNSGVILSQILRALADVTASAAADTEGRLADIDAVLFGAALRHAVGLVVGSMTDAVPGTIVSVLQAAAGAAERSAADGDDVAMAVLAATDAAVTALDKTPEQLGVLADAGVVDAGGRGLLVLLDALAATLTGHTAARQEYVPHPAGAGTATDTDHRLPPQFEVMYLLAGCDGEGLDALRERLEALGESVAIAGGRPDGHSVHVHADDAGAAVEAALRYGKPSRIQITALGAGVAPGRWTRRRAVLAVADGDGAERLFADEGAHVLRPEPDRVDLAGAVTAKELLQAVIDTGARQIMVLPNGYVAVEELVAGCTAANGWGIDVVPVPTGSMVQGLAALAVHEPDRPAVDDSYSMARAAGGTRRASVRVATERALTFAGPCDPGDGLGIAGDEVLVVRRDVGATARRLVDLLLAAGGELVTVLLGAGVDDRVGAGLAAHVRRHHLGTELVTYRTGHRGDALLIGVE